MIKWERQHLWVTNIEAERRPIVDMYVQTRWEDTLDGMCRPYSEILGYIQYDPETEKWLVFLHKGELFDTEAPNQLRAMIIVEQHFKSQIVPT